MTTTSASVGISVTNPSPNFVVLVPNGSTWLTYSGGVVPPLDNIGFAWYNTGYDTTGWSNLVAEIGDGDRADGYPETSVVDMGPATARHRAVWFKKEFDVINPGQFQNFRLRLLRDDGAVVHINDVPVWTNNMAFTMDSGLLIPRLDFSTNLAAIAAPDEGLVFQEFNLNPDNYPTLANGQWSIAVEVHQNSITSSDLSFDFMLWGEYATLPTLAITSPTNTTTVIAGSPFTVNIDSSTFVTNAETFINNASTGVTDDTRSVGSPSFSVTKIAPVTPGSYIITAKGRDSLPAANLATSAGVTITVIPNQPPVVNYTNVFNGANTGTVFFVGQIITNQFSVSDDQGVTNIDFLINGQLHFRTNGNFGVALVNDALAGTCTFTVRAYDGAGQTTDSSKTITVTNPPNVALLVTNGSIWKYDNSSNILDGTGWQNIVYAPEAGWASGPADIGGGSSGERNPERTIINIGVASRIPTVYFRRTFSVANPADYTGLVFNLLRDDGAVVYLNGNEVFRSNIGAAPTFLTLATAAAGDDGTTYVRSNAPNTLIAGNNVVAVEVHQSSFTSSDLTFDLMLWGSTAVVTGPTLTITLNANGSVTVTWNGGGTLIGSNDPSLPRASWTAVAGATSPHTFAAGTLAPFRFYAVRIP